MQSEFSFFTSMVFAVMYATLLTLKTLKPLFFLRSHLSETVKKPTQSKSWKPIIAKILAFLDNI